MTPSRRRLIVPISLTLVLGVAAPVIVWRGSAGRGPAPDERARVEAVLHRLGYLRWDEIELENGIWEVDDARDAEGREWDLKLRADTLQVIEREQDD